MPSRIPWLTVCAGVLLMTSLGCVDLHFLAHGNPGSRVTGPGPWLEYGDHNGDGTIDLIDYDPEKEEALASVRFTLYRPPRVQEIVLLDPQRWHYDRGRAKWCIDPDLDLYERTGR